MIVFCFKLVEYIIIKINFVDYGNFIGCSEDYKVSRYGNCGVLDILRIVKKVRKINKNIDNIVWISEW